MFACDAWHAGPRSVEFRYAVVERVQAAAVSQWGGEVSHRNSEAQIVQRA